MSQTNKGACEWYRATHCEAFGSKRVIRTLMLWCVAVGVNLVDANFKWCTFSNFSNLVDANLKFLLLGSFLGWVGWFSQLDNQPTSDSNHLVWLRSGLVSQLPGSASQRGGWENRHGKAGCLNHQELGVSYGSFGFCMVSSCFNIKLLGVSNEDFPTISGSDGREPVLPVPDPWIRSAGALHESKT